MSITLPAGSYVLHGKATVRVPNSDENRFGFCRFKNGDTSRFAFMDEVPQEQSVALLEVGTYGATATITVECFVTDAGVEIRDAVIVATRVGAIH